MFAIIETGGKQYRVAEGDTLTIERIPGDAESTVTFDRVLLTGEGSAITVGTPTIPNASVTAIIVKQSRAAKITVVKFKSKVRYRRRRGHSQLTTMVKITALPKRS